ncbi:hypothetical protein F511_30315 [Dorcoceras hygrometricum]|uniref:Uncharacterized protein n=1 Tax=Dorcoceras hygrometricum TaxID=472368 RepID=A0A2Z7AIB9_9LAMI|nr:hypothetical protein F511_30315 [Dorcoceras hygrometricum]
MRDTGPVELLLMYYELMDPCVDIMVKWQLMDPCVDIMVKWQHRVDWAVKMRIRPPELETSICDVKYHVSLGPNCYFGSGGPKNCFHIIILSFVNCVERSDLIVDRDYDGATSTPPSLLPLLTAAASPCRRRRAAAAACRRLRTCSDRLEEEIPSVKYSSHLVQTNEEIEISVVDRIRRTTTAYR